MRHRSRVALSGLLGTLGVPLLEGRDLSAADVDGASLIAVANRAFAERSWPGRTAVGQRVMIDGQWREIVGIAGDVKHRSLAGDAPATLYLPAHQSARRGYGFVIRTDADPAAVAQSVIDRMCAVDPRVAIGRVQVVETLIGNTLAPQRFRSTIMAFFAVVAVLLTTAGLYGVTSDAVVRRLREMAIRVALGATRASVVRLAVRSALAIAAGGAVGGVLLAAAASSAIAPYLYGIGATDAITYVAVVACTLLLCVLGAWVPARRAGAAEPVDLLRAE